MFGCFSFLLEPQAWLELVSRLLLELQFWNDISKSLGCFEGYRQISELEIMKALRWWRCTRRDWGVGGRIFSLGIKQSFYWRIVCKMRVPTGNASINIYIWGVYRHSFVVTWPLGHLGRIPRFFAHVCPHAHQPFGNPGGPPVPAPGTSSKGDATGSRRFEMRLHELHGQGSRQILHPSGWVWFLVGT